jgi:transposase
MTDLTSASPIASTVPIDRTPVATAGTPLTFRTVRQRWPLLILLAVLVPLVLGALAMVDGDRFLFWDAPLTAAAVDHRGTVIDNVSLAVSRLGAWPVVYPLGAAFALAAARRSSRLAWIIVATVAARPAVEWLLKEIVERPRPDGARLVAGTGFSFPSGHVLAAIATWAFLPAVVALYTRRRSLWWASVGVAGSVVALVAWSRVWLGVHWTSDVVASLALGYLAFNAVEAWLQRSARDDRSPCRRRAELIPEVGPVIPAFQPITRSDDRARIGGPARPPLGLDRTRWPELLLGLERVRVLEVARDGEGRLHVAIETTDELTACATCGVRAAVKDRTPVGFADLPAFGAPVRLVWIKRRWSCREPACGAQTWTEQRPDIAPARAGLTARAGMWATREVGAEIHTVAYVARQLGVTWHTVMDAVAYWGQALIEDPDRVAQTAAVGVDETKFLAARRRESTRWASAICDVADRSVIDVIEGRQGPELEEWLVEQPERWRRGVTVTVTDLHEPFRAALAEHLPNATAVADAFHVVAVGTRVVDRTRRRVQQETLGHRGHKDDPLYRSRKLLTMAAERLDDRGTTRLRGLLAAGDPDGQVYEAWAVKEGLRDLYTLWGAPELARRWLDALTADCRAGTGPEVRGMARTLVQWREAILAWHTTGYTNGPVEGLNSLIKKLKRVAAGFRSFTNHRLRILLAVGGCNWDLLGTKPR